jgi:hypothetical protein
MKHLSALCIAVSLSSPVAAEEETMSDLLKQFEELSKNAQTLLESWVEDIGPRLEDLGPTLDGLAERLGDLNAYHPPEVLENGDIIIRRKAPPDPMPEAKPENAHPKTEGLIDL